MSRYTAHAVCWPCGNSVLGYPPGSELTCQICGYAHRQSGSVGNCTNQCADCGHCHVAHAKA